MLFDPDYENMKLSLEDFVKRLAYHMGLPDNQYKRLTYTKLGDVFPDRKDIADNIRVDFDGGRPEFHLCACPFELTEAAARAIGQSFTYMLRKSVKSVEEGTWKKSGWIVV